MFCLSRKIFIFLDYVELRVFLGKLYKNYKSAKRILNRIYLALWTGSR